MYHVILVSYVRLSGRYTAGEYIKQMSFIHSYLLVLLLTDTKLGNRNLPVYVFWDKIAGFW